MASDQVREVMMEKSPVSFVVQRGAETGCILTPHKHDDGFYVASMTRFERDYVRVETLREILILACAGFSIRMSNPDSRNHRSPSLISPESMRFLEETEIGG